MKSEMHSLETMWRHLGPEEQLSPLKQKRERKDRWRVDAKRKSWEEVRDTLYFDGGKRASLC
jgi:hypothetical protein